MQGNVTKQISATLSPVRESVRTENTPRLSNGDVHLFDQIKWRMKGSSKRGKQREVQKSAAMKSPDAVAVHLMKLEDLPEPLSKREFREICQREGVPNLGGTIDGSQYDHPNEAFALYKDMQNRKNKERVNHTLNNMFGAYLSIFDLFKSWHSGIIQERHVGPEKVQASMKQSLQAAKKPQTVIDLTEKEHLHVNRQQKLVSLLLEYGIGLGLETGPISPGRSSRFAAHPMSLAAATPNALFDQRYLFPIISTQQAMSPQQPALQLQRSLLFPQPTNKKSQFAQERSIGVLRPSNDSLLSNTSRDGNKKGQNRSNSNHSRQSQARRATNFSLAHTPVRKQKRGTGGGGDFSAAGKAVLYQTVQMQEFSSSTSDGRDDLDQSPQAKMRLQIISSHKKQRVSSARKFTIAKMASHSAVKLHGHAQQRKDKTSLVALTENELNDEKEFYSELQQRLRKEVLESRDQITQLRQQLKHAEDRNVKMISRYTKDEVARSVHAKILTMPYPEQAEVIKNQIDAKFMNISDGLDPALSEVVNAKMAQMQDYFIGQIQLISHHTESLRQNVALMENLNRDGMKFADMDTDKLVERISDIEALKREQHDELRQLDPTVRGQKFLNRPFMIWRMFQKHFGSEYFLEVIEEEYGIAPGANDFFTKKIQEHFAHYLEQYKKEQRQLEDEHQKHVESLKLELEELTEQNTRLMRHDQVFQDKALKELRHNQKVLIKSQEEATIKAWKSKYINARDRVSELIKQRESEFRSLESAQMNYCWKKWHMFTMMSALIKRVEETGRTGIDLKVLKLCEQYRQDEVLVLRYSKQNRVPKELVREQLHIEKRLEWKHRLEEISDMYGYASNNAAAYSMTIEKLRAELEKQAEINRELKLKIPVLEAQNAKYRQALQVKEKESLALVDQVKTIENRWRLGTKEPFKFTAKPIFAALQLKSLNEFSAHLVRQAHAIANTDKSFSNSATMTDIADLRIKVDYEKLPSMTLGVDAEVDATQDLREESAQTVAVQTKEIASGKDRDFTLKSRKIGTDDNDSRKRLSKLSTLNELPLQVDKRKFNMRSSFAKSKHKMQSQVLNLHEFPFPNAKIHKENSFNSRQQSKEVLEEAKSLKRTFRPGGRHNTMNSVKTGENQQMTLESSVHQAAGSQTRGGDTLKVDNAQANSPFHSSHQSRRDNRSEQNLTPQSRSQAGNRSQRNRQLDAAKQNQMTRIPPPAGKIDTHALVTRAAEKVPSVSSLGFIKNKSSPVMINESLKKNLQGMTKAHSKLRNKNLITSKDKLHQSKQLLPLARLVSAHTNSVVSNKTRSRRELTKNAPNSAVLKPETNHMKYRVRKQQPLSKKSKNVLTEDRGRSIQQTLKSAAEDGQTRRSDVSLNERFSECQPWQVHPNYQEYGAGVAISQDNRDLANTDMSPASPAYDQTIDGDKYTNQQAENLENGGSESARCSQPPADQINYLIEQGQDEHSIQKVDNKSLESLYQQHLMNKKASTQPIGDATEESAARGSSPGKGLASCQSNYELKQEELRSPAMQTEEPYRAMVDYRKLSPKMLKRDMTEAEQTESLGTQFQGISRFTGPKMRENDYLSCDNSDQKRNKQKPQTEAIKYERSRPMTSAQKQGKNLFSVAFSSSALGLDNIDQFSRETQQNFQPKERLTLVRETECEQHPLQGEDAFVAMPQKTSTALLSNLEAPDLAQTQQYQAIDHNKYLHVKERSAPRAGNSSKKVSPNKTKSFDTDQDTSEDYRKRSSKVTPNNPSRQRTASRQNKQSLSPSPAHTKGGDDQGKSQKSAQHIQTKIQQLLLQGHINEEQFICLQLLEKGFIPSCPDDYQTMSRDSRSPQRQQKAIVAHNQKPHQSPQKILPRHSGPPFIHSAQGTSYAVPTSAEPSPSRSRSNNYRRRQRHQDLTYRIYPNKLPILQKILDRVYTKKCSKGTQCESTLAAAEAGPVTASADHRIDLGSSDWISDTIRAAKGQVSQKNSCSRLFKKDNSQPKLHSHRKLKTRLSTQRQPQNMHYLTRGGVQSNTQQQFLQMSNSQSIFSASVAVPNPRENNIATEATSGFKPKQSLNPQMNARATHERLSSGITKWINSIPLESPEPPRKMRLKTQKYHKINKHASKARLADANSSNTFHARTAQHTSMNRRNDIRSSQDLVKVASGLILANTGNDIGLMQAHHHHQQSHHTLIVPHLQQNLAGQLTIRTPAGYATQKFVQATEPHSHNNVNETTPSAHQPYKLVPQNTAETSIPKS